MFVSGRIDDKGYTVEIAIPLTSLRYKDGLGTWGFNVARIIKRKNEENLWTSWAMRLRAGTRLPSGRAYGA